MSNKRSCKQCKHYESYDCVCTSPNVKGRDEYGHKFERNALNGGFSPFHIHKAYSDEYGYCTLFEEITPSLIEMIVNYLKKG